MINIASYIDHTFLKPTATRIEINKICKEAVEYGFAAVCIPPPFIRAAVEEVGAQVKVATVIGFPFGYSIIAAKLAEVVAALGDGADEFDIVINGIAVKAGDWDYLSREMRILTERIHAAGRIVKVIIESGVLTDEEIIRCCDIYSALGVDFLKTSTGYAEKGASIAAVELMRRQLPSAVKIKASGGIRTYEFARQLIEAGAERLGCSGSVDIVKGAVAMGGGY